MIYLPEYKPVVVVSKNYCGQLHLLPGGICDDNLSITNGFVDNPPPIWLSADFDFWFLHPNAPSSNRNTIGRRGVTSPMRLPSRPQGGSLESDLWVGILSLLFRKENIPVNIINNEYLQLWIRKGFLCAAALTVKETKVDSSFHFLAANFCGSASVTGWYVPIIILFWGSQQEMTSDSQMLTMALKATWSQTTFVPLVYLIILSSFLLPQNSITSITPWFLLLFLLFNYTLFLFDDLIIDLIGRKIALLV